MILVTGDNSNIKVISGPGDTSKENKNVHPLVTQPSQGEKWIRYNLSSGFS